MKNILVISLLFLLASCSQSHKDEVIVPEDSGYYIVSKMNNLDWKGTLYVKKDANQDTLNIGGSFERPTTGTESLWMRIKFNGVGIYPLTGRQMSFSTVIGGDAFMNRYDLIVGESAKMVITKYDSTSKILEGTFEGILRQSRADVNSLDSLNVVDGKFRGYIGL